MFQTTPSKIDNIMQPSILDSNNQRDILPPNVLHNIAASNCSAGKSNSMHPVVHRPDLSSPASSCGTTTPPSNRSSFSQDSNASSSPSSSQSKRSSLKPNLKSAQARTTKPNRVSSPPTVRFADPEPMPNIKPKTLLQQLDYREQQNLHQHGTPNPMIHYHHRAVSSIAAVSLTRHSVGPQSYVAQPPQGVPTPQARNAKIRPVQRFSAPARHVLSDSRWSAIPLPEGFSPPESIPKSRTTSFQSVVSNLSVQSAPADLTSTATASPQGQYNSLEHYIPCIHNGCRAHYTPVHAGPTYYLAQGPYSIARLHGYCSRHALKEHKEANAACKREFERLRQNAGRKTLGQIAREFDIFLDAFREDRRLKSEDLKAQQIRIVLGSSSNQQANGKGKQAEDTTWDWRYTPRPCTKASCQNEHYSPFANHLYSFYTTPRPSTFLPLHTLCPACAKTEVEKFETNVNERWASRSGWDENEWNEWFKNAVHDRAMELDFWEKAQERVIKEKGPPRLAKTTGTQQKSGERILPNKPGQKKKSLFKRWFSSST